MKLYDRKEIGEILKKAAENSAADDTDTPVGLSIFELRQLASDAGIDPEEIEKAIAEIEVDSDSSERRFWGGPFSFNSQVVADGEITAHQWEEMLISIRNFFDSKGDVTTRESVMEWSSPWGTTNSARVTALKNNGKTKINVTWKGPLTAVPFYIPVPLVAIASVFFASEFLVLAAVPGVVFSLCATGLAFLVGRLALRSHLNKGLKKLKQLVAQLDSIASRPNPQPDLVLNQTDARPEQAEKSDPLLKIEMENNYEKADNDRRRSGRSKT